MTSYHGSPENFETAKAGQFFVGKTAEYSRRYGRFLYEIEFEGEPQFETPTIMVIDAAQITKVRLIEEHKHTIIHGK